MEKMLKENKNIDHSYTDRVVRQLVDETAIDFNAGKVHLPGTDYSWPFHNFGPGGLENALRMTPHPRYYLPRNNFGHHIITNYGVDDGEFEEVLTKYIGVIDGRIRDGLSELINKRDRENPHWLQENKNIDWDYTDRVVKQLVDETEIDFKNKRVKLDAAEYSFPFYSFGGRRAHRENLSFEPNSKFGKHVISNYGVDETEYKEIYAMYMGIIASRLQDHDENINHLHLHESTEDNFLDKIVDQLISETIIDYDNKDFEAPFIPSKIISFYSFLSLPFTLPLILYGSPLFLFKYCREVYGLTKEETQYVWQEYEKIIRDKINNKPLNESVIGKNDDEVIGKEFWFEYHCWESPESCDAEAWYRSHQKVRVIGRGEDDHDQYPSEVKVYKIRFEDGVEYDVFEDELLDSPEEFYRPAPPINESVDLSYSDDKDFPFLNQLANHTMSITEIGRNAVLFPFIDGYISDDNFYRYFNGTPYGQLPFEATLKLDEYLRDFGLTENEKEIWWDIYISKVKSGINQQDSNELNETTGDNVLDRIAHSMYKESISTPDSFPFDSTSMSFNDYMKNMYGISSEEAEYVYREFRYLKGWSEPDPYLPDPLNEHTFADDIDDPIYHQIANSIAQESEIIISPPPYNKMFLRSPAWKEAQHSENVIDQLTGRIKDVVPDRFVKHLKEIYNIKYPTFVNKVWELYKERIIDKIEKAHQTSNESTEDIYEKIVNSVLRESDILEKDGKLYLRSPAFEGGVNVEVVLDIISGRTKRAIPHPFVKHMKEIYNIGFLSGGTPIETVWGLYRDKMIERIKIKQAQLKQIPPKQRKFFDHILKTLVDGTEVQTMKDWNDDETYEQKVWVTPPFLNHGVDLPRYREDSVEWSEFSYFGYGYPSYMKDIYGLTDQEGLKLWAPYYKALQKKIEELIERLKKD